jgi:hypothetical protein
MSVLAIQNPGDNMNAAKLLKWAEQAGISISKNDGGPFPTAKQLEQFLQEAAKDAKPKSPGAVNTTNVLEHRFNPEGCQWEEYGKVVQLEDLSREDLLQVACAQMEILERMDVLQANFHDLVRHWRAGEIQPSDA